MPVDAEDAKGLLATAIEDPNPVLYFEHKHLYRRIKGEVPEDRYTTPFGKARIHRDGEDVTVITWGAMVYTADEAATKLADEGISVEILDLRTLIPWDREAVLESVARCSKALVLHEDTKTGGFGAEIAATIAEEAFEQLDAPVRRVAAPDAPVPFAPTLEKEFIPRWTTSQRRSATSPRTESSRQAATGGQMSTGTQVEVVMPQMGVSVSEGTVTRWLKQPGDTIALDEPLLEISTDKVDTEIPSPGEGVLAEVRVQEGETVEVGTVLAVIAPAGAAPTEAPAVEPPPPPSRPRRPSPRGARAAAGPEPPAAPADARPTPPPRRRSRSRAPAATAGRSSRPSSPGSRRSTTSTRVRSRARARAGA